MTDPAASLSIRERVERRLAQRYRAEMRFRAAGLGAVVAAVEPSRPLEEHFVFACDLVVVSGFGFGCESNVVGVQSLGQESVVL